MDQVSALMLLEGLPRIGLDLMAIMIVISFIVGFLSIGALLRVARRMRFWRLSLLLGILAIVPILFSLK